MSIVVTSTVLVSRTFGEFAEVLSPEAMGDSEDHGGLNTQSECFNFVGKVIK